MGQQFLLRFLLLCVLSQGFASLSNNGSSADLLDHLVRKKRVIDRTGDVNPRVRRLRDVNYIVLVQKHGDYVCAGSILSASVIITLGTCVEDHATYSIRSATIRKNSGSIHNVHGILIHPEFAEHGNVHDIALLSIQPPIITLSPNFNQPITIYNSNNGMLPAHSLVTVSGWGLTVDQAHNGVGCINPSRARTRFIIHPNTLRSITINTIGANECRERHDDDPAITNQLICTFHEEKYCGPRDDGAPLVFENQLAGMLFSDGFLRGPDLYVNVALPANRAWIYEHMNHIPEYVPRSPSPPRHNHRQPQTCSQVHPCHEDNE